MARTGTRPGRWSGLALAMLVVTGVGASAGPVDAPGDWQVRVRHWPVAVKKELYGFHVTVKNGDGQPINDARVRLRLSSFGKRGYRYVDASRIGDGWYRAVTRLNPRDPHPRDVRVVVEPGGD